MLIHSSSEWVAAASHKASAPRKIGCRPRRMTSCGAGTGRQQPSVAATCVRRRPMATDSRGVHPPVPVKVRNLDTSRCCGHCAVGASNSTPPTSNPSRPPARDLNREASSHSQHGTPLFAATWQPIGTFVISLLTDIVAGLQMEIRKCPHFPILTWQQKAGPRIERSRVPRRRAPRECLSRRP